MSVRLLFIIYDKYKCYHRTEKMTLVELLTLITVISLLRFLARFKSSYMQRRKVEVSECNWYVSASCSKQASPPVFFVWHV